jgi:HK97 family phage major capsid protein/HK97 family phage prohead protease
MKKHIKPGSIASRSILLERAAINQDARTIELAFSSEEPYDRYWGREILDHSPDSIRLGRLQAGGPLLMDHDSRDHVGVIESVSIGPDRVGRATVRFGKSARAEEVYQDVLDGIRRNVSVGYAIHDADMEKKGEKGDLDTFRVKDWEPFEISLVSVPADSTVGVGRSAESAEIQIIETEETPIMSDVEIKSEPSVDLAKAEKQRAAEIVKIGEGYSKFGADKLAGRAITEGWTVDQFKSEVMMKMAEAPKPTAEIGLSQKEAKQFSFLRAINALANPTDRRSQEAASFEREVSEAVADKMGREARGFYIPQDVQSRDLNVTTSTAGGHTVATDLLASSFIDLLRNKLMVMQMGAQMLTGLNGNIAIPRQTGGATAYWVAESGSPTESQQAFDQVTMSPKTVGAFTDISRKLLLQSSIDAEGFVRNDLATTLATAIDLAAITGTGADNQPTGIVNVSGIGDVAGGTNGLAPTWAHIVELWSDLATANADVGTTGLLTNSKVVGKLMSTLKASGVSGYIVEDFPGANGMTSCGGMRMGVSNQVPSNLDKGTSVGVCSAIIAGNWNDLIVGQWGALDLMADPYTGSTSGTLRVVALQDIDIAVRHAVSFSAMLDALTA